MSTASDLTTEEVAAELKCSPLWVREQAAKGRLPHYRIGDHKQAQFRFTRADVDDFKLSLRPAPATPARKRRRRRAA